MKRMDFIIYAKVSHAVIKIFCHFSGATSKFAWHSYDYNTVYPLE